jgi:flagellar protein FliO/FliZ
MEWVFVKMMLSLAAVLGLMFGLVYLMKRFMLPGRSPGTTRFEIDILGQRSLGPKRSIVVVKVLQQILVLGVTEQGMQVLAEQPDDAPGPEMQESVLPPRNVKQTPRGMWQGVGSFTDHLQAYAHILVKK